MANAYISTRASSRAVHIETLRNIPVPPLDQMQIETLSSLVQHYVEIRNKWIAHELEEDWAKSRCLRLMSEIDTEVLKAYDFSPGQERALLDWFTGSKHLGPVEFTEYSPRSFTPSIHWQPYISQGLPTDGHHGYLDAALRDLARVVEDAKEEGWTEPTPDGMKTAAELVRILYDISPRRYDIYPMEDGEVVIDGGDQGRRIGVFCFPDGRVLYIGWADGQRQRLRGMRTEDIPHDFLRRALGQIDQV